MSIEENKRLVRRYYEEIVSTGEVAGIENFIAPDYVEVHDNRSYPIGIDGAREHVLGVRRTYPDLRLTVERQIAEEEWVATRVTMRGTHLGEWMGMKPTGKPLEVTAVNLDRIVGGRIVEHGGAASLLGPLLEIGAVRVAEGDGLSVALAFVDAINRHDVEALCRLMTDDHRFLDASGVEQIGRETMRAAWSRYFVLVPDYAIEIGDRSASGSLVLLTGTAHGTVARDGPRDRADRWEVPAAWRARVEDGRVTLWQVFADNEPLRRIMSRRGRS